VYIPAPFYPECNYLIIAERPSRDGYRSRPLLRWKEDEIAEIRTVLQKITRHRISNANDAEDLVQDTLLTLISRNPGEDLKKGLLVWCQGILRNKVGNYYRKTRRHEFLKEKHSDMQQQHLPPPAASPEITASNRELRSIIEKKLAELPPDIRHVMELLVSGLNAGEIAKQLSPEPYQNVINRLYRGRKKLARELLKCGIHPNSGNGTNRRQPGKDIARKVS
jgi:RNA polymerase sigma factor (sigma-70 family)